jgi:F-type H+-transporting ATPase subunit gamma
VASLRDIRRRIRSVKNTQQITRAMQRVAFSRLRVAQARTLASRPYAEAMQDVLRSLPTVTGSERDALQEQRAVSNILVVHVTPDRGLCGALPGNVNRRLARFILEQTVPVSVIAAGRRGRDFVLRTGRHLVADFSGLGDAPSAADAAAIARAAVAEFRAGRADAVYLTYTRLISTLRQEPTVVQLLPVAPVEPQQREDRPQALYDFEPEPGVVLQALLPRYVEMQIYQALLESKASEQSARMVAMQNASDNAADLVDSLTLSANKARQAGITRELAEIVGGAAALEQG